MNLNHLTPEEVRRQLNEQIDLESVTRVMGQLSKADLDNFKKAAINMKKVMDNDGFDKKEAKEIFIFLLDEIIR